MAEPTPALAVTRVPGLRWRVYAVSEGTVVVGYLSRLPDGRWLVYDAQGIVRVGFLRPRDALAALWATVRSR